MLPILYRKSWCIEPGKLHADYSLLSRGFCLNSKSNKNMYVFDVLVCSLYVGIIIVCIISIL